MTPEFKHELTTGVPTDFPTGLCADVEGAADDDRVIMDREDNNVRVAAADDEALRWLIGYLDDTGNDHARQLADAIESTFLDGDNARYRNPPEYYGIETPGSTVGTSPHDRVAQSDADEVVTLEKEIGTPGDNMLSRFQQDVMEQVRNRLEKVGAPAKVTVTIEVEEVD